MDLQRASRLDAGDSVCTVPTVHPSHQADNNKNRVYWVANYTDEFNEHSEALREARRHDDFVDLQDAIAGRSVGRQRRHIPDNDIDPVTGEKRKSISDIVRETLDWLLLNNPEYARIHGEAMSVLQRAEGTASGALERTLDALTTARTELHDMLERAPTLPDGRKVFRDGATGHVYDAEGLRIPDDLAAGIEWPEGAADNRDYIAKKKHIQELEDAERELRGIQTELGGIRGELTNNENPPRPERVKSLKDQIEELHQQSADVLANHVSKSMDPVPAPGTDDKTSAINVPTMPKGLGE